MSVTLIGGAHDNDMIISEAVIILQLDVIAAKAMSYLYCMFSISLEQPKELRMSVFKLLVVKYHKNLVSND